MRCLKCCLAVALSLCGAARARSAEPQPPRIVAESPGNEAAPLKFPDGTLRLYYILRPAGDELRSIASRDHGETWSGDRLEFKLPGQAYHAIEMLRDDQGELHAAFHILGQDARGRRYDLWHNRTSQAGQQWGEPQRLYEGYVGSLRSLLQLPEGRIVLPFHFNVNHDPRPVGVERDGIDLGQGDSSVLLSDDRGSSWRRSISRLIVPQDTLRGRTRYGAVEPHVARLADGRLWMLIRTKNGHLWESFSTDRGETWSAAQSSRFVSSDSPASTLRLKDGRLILFLNACQQWDDPKSYAIGGRHVLHAALSRDEARTWQGFREVHREPAAGANRGDRGTAYPSAVEADDGQVVLATGQGFAKSIIRFDPDWLELTTAQSDGLKDWTWYGASEPMLNPGGSESTPSFTLRKTDARLPACVVWNFPARRVGTLTLQLQLEPGTQSAKICLTDHFNIAGDTQAEEHAVLSVPASASGKNGSVLNFTPGEWQTLTLHWDLPQRADARLDEQPPVELRPARASEFGLNYLRLSVGGAPGKPGGMLVGAVSVGQ